VAAGSVQLLKVLAMVKTPELFQIADRLRFGSSTIVPRLGEVAIDHRVLVFALSTSMFTGIVFGLVPAFHLWRMDHVHNIRDTAAFAFEAGLASRRRTLLRHVLLVGQLALATTLLVGAGLLLHSFVNLAHVNTGYDPMNVLSFQLVLPPEYAPSRKAAIADQLTRKLRALAEVRSVGFTNMPPLTGATVHYGVFVPRGHTLQEMLRDPRRPQARSVSRDYLNALGVQLLDGRWFEERDSAGRPLVLLVNRTLARRYFGEKGVVGAVVRLMPSPDEWRIIGIVDDVRQGSLDTSPDAQIYVDYRQALSAMNNLPERARETLALGFLSYAIRVHGEPIAALPDVRTLVREVDAGAALDGPTTMEELVSASVMRPRFFAVLLSVFAATAALIAAIGIYGVLAHLVSQRTHEIGIRLALGAQPADVMAAVLRQGAILAATGVAIGLAGAVAFSRYLAGMLFGLTPFDASTYGAVVIVFIAVAMMASYVPARRATNVDPLISLRYE
jgi:putative ABC transport system permease protein